MQSCNTLSDLLIVRLLIEHCHGSTHCKGANSRPYFIDGACDIFAFVDCSTFDPLRHLPVLGIEGDSSNFDDHLSWTRTWNGSIANLNLWANVDYSFLHRGGSSGRVLAVGLCEAETGLCLLILMHVKLRFWSSTVGF